MQLNWKLTAGAVVLIIAIVLTLRFTRRITPFHPPADRQASNWGTVDADTAARLQSILDEEVNLVGALGLQGHVRTADGLTWSGTSGTVDLARRTPMQRDHVLRVGSTTKTFTAVVILRLVQQGRISLDAPLSQWFPDFPNAQRITVRQLLNHTSGIPDVLASPEILMRSMWPSTYWKQQDLLDIVSRSEDFTAPGAEWRYSNTNYILLGLISEDISGSTFASELRETITGPLGLDRTYFLPYEPAPAALIPGFDRDLSKFPGMLDVGVNDTSWPTAAYTSGALASNAEDLGLFYSRLLAGDLLSAPAMDEMMTFVEAPNPGFSAQDGYGLGLMRIHAGGTEFVGHVGQFMGSTAVAMYSPKEQQLIVITANLSYPDLLHGLVQLHQAIR